MHTLRGSRFHSPTHFAFCDGVIEGFGSLTTAPAGYSLSLIHIWIRHGRGSCQAQRSET